MDFDTSINYDYIENKQDAQTNIISNITGGVTATVVDAGIGLWNSLPLTKEIDTRDVLERISNNALQVYNENPELIQTASFIAGSFLPAGLAMKGMKAMRAGVKGMDWFSAAGKEAELANLGKLFAEGGKGTKEYRAAVRGMYARTAVNQAIDAVAVEGMVVGMMQETPMMEDYMKDPVQNFGISIALGGVLGTGIGIAAEHFAVRSMAGKLTEEASVAIRDKIGYVPKNATNGVAMQVLGKSLGNLDEMIAQGKIVGKTADNDLTMSAATQMQAIYTKEVSDIFEASVDATYLKSLNPQQKATLQDWMVNTPELLGVQGVSVYEGKQLLSEKLLKAPKAAMTDEPSLLTSTVGKDGPNKPEGIKSLYFPELGLYGIESDAAHFAGAGALYDSASQAAAPLKKYFGKNPDHDTLLSLQVKSSATAQGDLIGSMQVMDNMSLSDFKKLLISPTDTNMLMAAKAKMAKDPEFMAVGIKLQDTNAYNAAVIAEKLPNPESYAFASASNIKKYSIRETDRADNLDARVMLKGWVAGNGVGDVRLASELYKRGGFANAGALSVKNSVLLRDFTAIVESPESVALRAEFRKVADPDGYVYLYRGRASDKERGGVRSYAVESRKAGEFGKPELYKVRVDDIIAGFNDLKSSDGIARTEIMVMEGERFRLSFLNH